MIIKLGTTDQINFKVVNKMTVAKMLKIIQELCAVCKAFKVIKFEELNGKYQTQLSTCGRSNMWKSVTVTSNGFLCDNIINIYCILQ